MSLADTRQQALRERDALGLHRVRLARHAVTPMTAGLPSTADTPVQGSEMARSAITGNDAGLPL